MHVGVHSAHIPNQEIHDCVTFDIQSLIETGQLFFALDHANET